MFTKGRAQRGLWWDAWFYPFICSFIHSFPWSAHFMPRVYQVLMNKAQSCPQWFFLRVLDFYYRRIQIDTKIKRMAWWPPTHISPASVIISVGPASFFSTSQSLSPFCCFEVNPTHPLHSNYKNVKSHTQNSTSYFENKTYFFNIFKYQVFASLSGSQMFVCLFFNWFLSIRIQTMFTQGV